MVDNHIFNRTKLCRFFKQNKPFIDVGIIGDIKALGLSYAKVNDTWNVHSHIMICARKEFTPKQKSLIITKWHKLSGANFEHGCKFTECDKSAHYMANQIPKVTNQILNAIAEAPDKASKELLEYRYCELVEAVKGRTCVGFSTGLKCS